VDYYELIYNEVPYTITLYSKSTPSALEHYNETNKKRGGTYKTKQNHITHAISVVSNSVRQYYVKINYFILLNYLNV